MSVFIGTFSMYYYDYYYSEELPFICLDKNGVANVFCFLKYTWSKRCLYK